MRSRSPGARESSRCPTCRPSPNPATRGSTSRTRTACWRRKARRRPRCALNAAIESILKLDDVRSKFATFRASMRRAARPSNTVRDRGGSDAVGARREECEHQHRVIEDCAPEGPVTPQLVSCGPCAEPARCARTPIAGSARRSPRRSRAMPRRASRYDPARHRAPRCGGLAGDERMHGDRHHTAGFGAFLVQRVELGLERALELGHRAFHLEIGRRIVGLHRIGQRHQPRLADVHRIRLVVVDPVAARNGRPPRPGSRACARSPRGPARASPPDACPTHARCARAWRRSHRVPGRGSTR